MKKIIVDVAKQPLAILDDVLYFINDSIRFGRITDSHKNSFRALTLKLCAVKDDTTREITRVENSNILKIRGRQYFRLLSFDREPKPHDLIVGIDTVNHKLFYGKILRVNKNAIIAKNKYETIEFPKNQNLFFYTQKEASDGII